ncbi:hypothetical protein F5880DRAFT_684398 [Lentinula raphanica]|nr:hypothetical protein F5880DRAFT_684398 [Lentinula raphanica]
MYRYSRPRSRNNASSHLLFAVLLLAMLIGACIASPVPSESETDAPISPQVTGSDHLHVRRAFKQTVKKGFKKMKFWGSNEDGKDDDTVSAKEGGKDKTVLGYSYHVYNIRTSQYEWKYPDSTVGKDPIDKRAIQRLETIMAEFKDDRWVPYFPGPNYYRKFLNPQGNLFYYQVSPELCGMLHERACLNAIVVILKGQNADRFGQTQSDKSWFRFYPGLYWRRIAQSHKRCR